MAYIDFASRTVAEMFIQANHKRKLGREKLHVTFNKKK
jgi:hypothetical protein